MDLEIGHRHVDEDMFGPLMRERCIAVCPAGAGAAVQELCCIRGECARQNYQYGLMMSTFFDLKRISPVWRGDDFQRFNPFEIEYLSSDKSLTLKNSLPTSVIQTLACNPTIKLVVLVGIASNQRESFGETKGARCPLPETGP
ncbi:hypothetical protein [Deinococcus sp. AJ005]|uniref:hypothetical protein n=1 Tax=Deinococcus sp. AJ005 TaxID=2652443 RepID=UPI00125CCBEE|nr:hypothetical protein [Deinococcus sp. AJ005]QFP77941.1 hypothetical protein DAAJ005_16930 [Deinococcus sp. AJ005]